MHASGRTQREVADDLGIQLSTLVHWIGGSRDRLIDEGRASSAPSLPLYARPFMGTKRIVLRITASLIASASAASVLPRFTTA